MAYTEGYMQHDGVQLHFLHWGLTPSAYEERPLILLHGFAQSAQTWADVAPQLASTRAVYALDLVGHGKSDCPDNPSLYSLDFQADALLSFMQNVSRETLGTLGASENCELEKAGVSETPAASASAVEVSGRDVSRETPIPQTPAGTNSSEEAERVKPAVLGYSMGGRVVLTALMHAPGQFGTLILESAGLGPLTEEDRNKDTASDAERAELLRTQGLAAFMKEWAQLPLFASQAYLPQATQDHIKASRLANNAEALARTFEQAGQHIMPYRNQILDALRSPTLPIKYLCGSLDKKYSSLASDLAADAEMPIAIQTFEGAGHNVHLECPEQFVCAVENFLCREK